jgi:hypothetical protein
VHEHRESALGRALVLSRLVVGRPIQVLRRINALLHHLYCRRRGKQGPGPGTSTARLYHRARSRTTSRAQASTFFFLETGHIFIDNSDSLQPNAYNTLERKEDYIQIVASFSRSSSSPAAGTVALKPTTLPTKDLQRF